MLEHAKDLDFEKAAQVRDQLAIMRQQAFGASGSDNMALLVPQSS
jgi:excinuclease ABC subunit B